MDKIDLLISYLFAIESMAKDVHYSSKGKDFYSSHLLADKVYKDIGEHIDALFETCILPYDKPKRIITYWEIAIDNGMVLNDYSIDFHFLMVTIQKCLDHIELMQGYTKGEQALFDNIAQDLQRKLGLITRQVG